MKIIFPLAKITSQKQFWSIFCDTQTENYVVRWEIILAGLVTTRQSHPVRAREAREFINNGM